MKAALIFFVRNWHFKKSQRIAVFFKFFHRSHIIHVQIVHTYKEGINIFSDLLMKVGRYLLKIWSHDKKICSIKSLRVLKIQNFQVRRVKDIDTSEDIGLMLHLTARSNMPLLFEHSSCCFESGDHDVMCSSRTQGMPLITGNERPLSQRKNN